MSRLETGKPTPSSEDLRLWANAVGRPDVAEELGGGLTGLETRYLSIRRRAPRPPGGRRRRDRSHHGAPRGGGGADSRAAADRRLRPARVRLSDRHRHRRLGIVSFSAQLRRSPRSRLLDLRPALFIVETLSTEMWLDDEENLALSERAWDWLAAPVTGGSLAPPVGERGQVWQVRC
ncbi:hypothetical protein [Streptomyces sp. NPDC102487]|uniref:hypothetical protein n=1 Tax=Streptomyces sp. NPDC102487 TaxID=3366182 RepID=UPI003813EFCD